MVNKVIDFSGRLVDYIDEIAGRRCMEFDSLWLSGMVVNYRSEELYQIYLRRIIDLGNSKGIPANSCRINELRKELFLLGLLKM